MTLVSVVMPVYNSAKYLAESVNSVLGQSFTDFELIAVDDGSTDASGVMLEHLSELHSRIKVIHKENQGIAAALNTGIEAATGKYIARIDSDDLCLPERFSKQVAFMEKNADYGVCGTRCSFFGDTGSFDGAVPPVDPKIIKGRLLFSPTISHTSVMMRRDLIVDNKLFYSLDVGQAEDYDLWTRFSRHSKITNLTEVLTSIRTHSDSVTRRKVDKCNEWLSIVHRKVLWELGVDPSDEEFCVHLSVSTGNFYKSKEFICNVERWLCKLLDANESNKLYDSDALAKVFFEKWWSVCFSVSVLGPWTWQTFYRSRLSSGSCVPIRQLTPFFIKCMLRKERLRPAKPMVG